MKKIDFRKFLGLSSGDTSDAVLRLFGEPDQSYNNPENHYIIHYFRFSDDDVLSVSINKADQKIETVFFGGRNNNFALDWIDSLRIDDPKATLLGKHIDEIIDILGVPDEEEPDDFLYQDDGLEVDFYCPEENDFFCKRIMVTWYLC